MYDAGGGTRTPTLFRAPGPKAGHVLPVPARPLVDCPKRRAAQRAARCRTRRHGRFYDSTLRGGRTSVRPGYELWRPNQGEGRGEARPSAIVALLVVVTAGQPLFVVTVGGWPRCSTERGRHGDRHACCGRGSTPCSGCWSSRWSRGILPVAAALGDDPGDLLRRSRRPTAGSPAPRPGSTQAPDPLPDDLLGLLTVLVLALLQLLLIAVALLRLQPGVARRRGAPDRLRRGLRRRCPAGPSGAAAAGVDLRAPDIFRA